VTFTETVTEAYLNTLPSDHRLTMDMIEEDVYDIMEAMWFAFDNEVQILLTTAN